MSSEREGRYMRLNKEDALRWLEQAEHNLEVAKINLNSRLKHSSFITSGDMYGNFLFKSLRGCAVDTRRILIILLKGV